MNDTSSLQAKLQGKLSTTSHQVDGRLDVLLRGGPPRLLEAMRYAVLGGGKRLRPVFCLWTHAMLTRGSAEARGAAAALDAACALEFVHSYSLVHDDLPCMDDDSLRRGQPTCHVRFDEATAVLAGDALLALAFDTLAAAAWPAPSDAVAAVRVLAEAAGHRQLVGGQALDLEAGTREADARLLEAIHKRKTAALIAASFQLGGIAAGAAPGQLAALRQIGMQLGQAFQITDDILDQTSTAQELGKTPGKDLRAGKLTAVSVCGIEVAREQARAHVERAAALLQAWPDSQNLQDLGRYLASRAA